MSKVKIATTQMSCSWDIEENIKKAESLVVAAAGAGANIILLPELFETPYFCQQESSDFFSLATSVEESKAVKHFQSLCKELEIVMPVSFFEKKNKAYFNSVAIIDADGSILGVYRKSHIPTGPQYEEKAYFTPGDTGFKVWNTTYAKIGVGICWDQYSIEEARIMALLGAEVIMYPSACGNDPYVKTASKVPWQNVMRGHAASNMLPVMAANRVGNEYIKGTFSSSDLDFFGAAFIAEETGEIVAEADDHSDMFVAAEFDLGYLENKRASYGLFRDRRTDLYSKIVEV